jgi:Ca2+-binding RTX toxin-like protein
MASRLASYLQCATAVSTACLFVALIGVCFAAPASARTRCSYSGPPDNLLTVRAGGDAYSNIAREGEQIVVGEYGKPPGSCSGGVPTVFNTDRVRFVYRGDFSSVDVLLGSGPLAPGATPEPEGASEIEIELIGPLHASVLGTGEADEFHWGPGGAYHAGLNLNPREAGDRDVDVTLQKEFAFMVAKGLGGDDTIVPAPGFSSSHDAVFSQGWGGDDRLVAPRNSGGRLEGLAGDDVLIGGSRGDLLDAGGGNDRVEAGGGADRIYAGPGRDLILSGTGRDEIHSRDSRRDTIKCGPGRDRVFADHLDRLRGCEQINRR